MSHTESTPSQALYSFTLNHEQVYNVAASLASDIGCADDVMPIEFLQRHYQLLEIFLKHLTALEQIHVVGSISQQGALQ